MRKDSKKNETEQILNPGAAADRTGRGPGNFAVSDGLPSATARELHEWDRRMFTIQ